MTRNTKDPWESATFEGARRAQIRRSMRLSPRRRLEAMIELEQTAKYLAAVPRASTTEASTSRSVNEPSSGYDGISVSREHSLVLSGCTPVPLASYLKALGILRLVVEQADPEARGCWQNEQFVLESRLDAEELKRFFLEEYRPTPLLAPWGARSGFYPGSAESGARKILETIEATEDARLEFFRQSIQDVRALLKRYGFSEKPGDDRKLELLRLCRAELPEELVQWLDACYTLTADWRRFPPLLETGGNEGSGSYLFGFGQMVVDCLHKRVHDTALDAALLGASVPDAQTDQLPGQFAPDMAGGPNQGAGYSGDLTTNPWDCLLALEGTLLFYSATTRRSGR
ncbi:MULTISPECIES: type I-U CRISPR-associated protein Csx17 [Halorhodospira]|uniref:type I-G CRISPR-associated protein Cas8g1/Csx17 n=2 Tax=Ectothiorhodospiraceae TaxID=72276 RepID=UPI001EE99876|nr:MULTISPECIES: type I-U CRISPR-associated protein Csx17 [Halorhodospira]MCG5527195.1 type I-U CRISPR-associated protein Csx17 [Halorhodospira halophila]MCG5543461.1 type I-U CRISPR-associated protein Csx17 [Halorhodospira sp. 9628]